MSWVSGILVYFLIWWVALFCVLPIGVRPDVTGQSTPGGWRGAPARTRVGVIILGTTILAAILWAGVWWLMSFEGLSFRDGLLAR